MTAPIHQSVITDATARRSVAYLLVPSPVTSAKTGVLLVHAIDSNTLDEFAAVLK